MAHVASRSLLIMPMAGRHDVKGSCCTIFYDFTILLIATKGHISDPTVRAGPASWKLGQQAHATHSTFPPPHSDPDESCCKPAFIGPAGKSRLVVVQLFVVHALLPSKLGSWPQTQKKHRGFRWVGCSSVTRRGRASPTCGRTGFNTGV